MRLNYHNRKFVAVENSENGAVTPGLIFHYLQTGNIITSEYAGGGIIKGQLIGVVDDSGLIDIRYQQINQNGELMTGICQSMPELMENGKIRLYEKWRWTSGDQSAGTSILEELNDII